MKRLQFIVLMYCISIALYSTQPTYGLGLIVGEPTGISLSYVLGEQTSFHSAAAWSFEKKASIHLHGDLVFFNTSLIPHEQFRTYTGLGMRVKLKSKSKLGVRVPLGISFTTQSRKITSFFEIVPVMDLVPSTKFSINSGLGIRYNFNL